MSERESATSKQEDNVSNFLDIHTEELDREFMQRM